MVKIINRNIKFDSQERQETSSYKCLYGDKHLFDKLQINISYESEYRAYEIESKNLTSSKSIHFKVEKRGDTFEINWSPQIIVPHIKRIK